jgi:predicted RNA-binding protein Jag
MFMKKCYGRLLLITSLMILPGCQAYEGENTYQKELVVEKTMNSSVKIDPTIDLSNNEPVSIIIEFKTKPAKLAVLEAEGQGLPMTLQAAKKHVEESHQEFQKELQKFLDENDVEYRITHKYKTAFNGVSMELPGNEIKRLMGSSVISKIYPNQEIQLNPPPQ